MYERLNQPANSLQPLWRYLTYPHLVDLLSSGELFFAHLPGLSDGLEGALTERTRERLFTRWYAQYGDAALAAGSVADYEQHREGFFVNCWHMNDAESYLMWKVYGNRGFAVQTTFERVQGAFDTFPGVVQGSPVQYLDFSREAFDIGNVFTAVIKKDMPYRDEREFRLLFWRPDRANSSLSVGATGIRVQVDLNMLIQNIYVSPQFTGGPDAIARLIEAKHLVCSLVSSAIRERGR